MTPEQICVDVIDTVAFQEFAGTTVTVCLLTLRNGAQVIGHHCGARDPAGHSLANGQYEARAMALAKVAELEGYRLRDESNG